MTAAEMWEAYGKEHPECRNVHYEAWRFGVDTSDELAALALAGVKTATASAYPCYEHENCPIPKAGDYSVILDMQDQAVCIIQTARVTVVPFDEVDAQHAYAEGEGDRSLAYWRSVHEEVFTMELKEIGQTFTPRMPVVCEAFVRVYPARTQGA